MKDISINGFNDYILTWYFLLNMFSNIHIPSFSPASWPNVKVVEKTLRPNYVQIIAIFKSSLYIFSYFFWFPLTGADKISVVAAQKGSRVAGPFVIFSVGLLELVEHRPQVLPGVVEPVLFAYRHRWVGQLSHREGKALDAHLWDRNIVTSLVLYLN